MTSRSVAKSCSVEGCGSPVECRDLCNKHYLRLRHRGTTDAREILTFENQRIFWSRVNKNAPGGCWEWTAALNVHGYGVAVFQRKRWRAHRLAWLFVKGTPATLFLLHSCDNPKCVNPEHLREGTQQENLQDARDRDRAARGFKFPHAKLSEAQVQEILEAYQKYIVTMPMLAKRYSVSKSAIASHIYRRGGRQ